MVAMLAGVARVTYQLGVDANAHCDWNPPRQLNKEFPVLLQHILSRISVMYTEIRHCLIAARKCFLPLPVSFSFLVTRKGYRSDVERHYNCVCALPRATPRIQMCRRAAVIKQQLRPLAVAA